ncbi:methionine ABC transporter ATP-binding protein [Brevibacterium album]|uniref:methionine ABC transporter ATP-binding protein n=1 Tax=Brevibacterium album TaxID=417948 RepID=UPI000421FDD7|nr:methionine ABC transporter ATP-binding protein [Brevibacterium album]
MSSDHLIEFKEVTRTFGSGERAVTAVDRVSLHVDRGEVFGIIGFSGAGKSTLIRMINGLEKPTSGSVTVLGQEISAMRESRLPKVRSRIGMVFQQFNLFHSRTVSGNVAYPLKVAGWSKARRRERVAELLEFVGLAEKAGQHPEELSGGQKQRVGIARALAAEPDILLADESTSALDPNTTGEVLRLLRRANEEFGITIVAITHEMEVIRAIADRVAVMDRGRIVETGRVYDIFSNPRESAEAGFVESALKDRPSAEDVQRIRETVGGRLVTVSLQDSGAVSTVLGSASAHGVTFEIVHGGMNTTKNASYGLLTVAVDGADAAVDAFIAELSSAGRVQEVHG